MLLCNVIDVLYLFNYLNLLHDYYLLFNILYVNSHYCKILTILKR